MITGYNTDVEHEGVVYHVQTEDKGPQTPMILSLVYTGGEILASKRSPYDDLIALGLDLDVLAERLQRQHKLICAAVHAGRIEDLKRMNERDSSAKEPSGPQVPAAADAERNEPGETHVASAAVPDEDRFAITKASDESLTIGLLDDRELRAGESVTLQIQVTRPTNVDRKPVPGASITLKTLGSNFQSSSTYSTTDRAGRSSISVSLPVFKTGRGAILIRAEADGEVAELRRIIQPS